MKELQSQRAYKEERGFQNFQALMLNFCFNIKRCQRTYFKVINQMLVTTSHCFSFLLLVLVTIFSPLVNLIDPFQFLNVRDKLASSPLFFNRNILLIILFQSKFTLGFLSDGFVCPVLKTDTLLATVHKKIPYR